MKSCQNCNHKDLGDVCEDCIRDMIPNSGAKDRWSGVEEVVKEEVKDQTKGFRTKKLDAARKKKAKEIEGMTEEAMEVKKREQMKQKRPDIIVWGGYE